MFPNKKFSALVVAALFVAGCETSSEEVADGRNDVREAKASADQTVADVQNETNLDGNDTVWQWNYYTYQMQWEEERRRTVGVPIEYVRCRVFFAAGAFFQCRAQVVN